MNARRHLTVRDLPPKVSSALDTERRRRGTSLNQTVIDLLTQALGVRGPRRNGLARFGGTWSAKELREFKSSVTFEAIDPEFWR